MYEHIRKYPRQQKKYMMKIGEHIGKGASGQVFTAHLKPKDKFPQELILKELKRSPYSENEFQALKFST